MNKNPASPSPLKENKLQHSIAETKEDEKNEKKSFSKNVNRWTKRYKEVREQPTEWTSFKLTHPNRKYLAEKKLKVLSINNDEKENIKWL